MVWTIPCFLSGGAALSLATFIIWRKKTGSVFLALLSMMAITAWVQLANGFSLLFESQYLLWRQLSLLGEIFWPVAMYQVACSFTKQMSLSSQQTLVWRFRALLAVGVILGVFLLSLPDVVMTAGIEQNSVVFQRPWGRMIWGFILVGLILALSELEHILRVSRDPLRYQIKFVVIGVGGMSAIALVQASQMLLFSIWQQEYTWMAAIAVLLSVGLVAYGLSRWGTEDLSPKTFCFSPSHYTSLTFLIVGVYLLCVGLVVAVVRQTDWAISSALGMLLLFVSGLILVVAMFSRQVRAELQAFIANNFYRSKYDYRSKWLQLTDSFSSCRSLEDILDEFLNILSRTFGAPKVTIWMKFQTDNKFHQVRTLTTEMSNASLSHSHPLIVEFVKQLGPITIDLQQIAQNEEMKSFIEDTRAVVLRAVGVCI